MATKFILDGIKELKAALRELPEELADEGGDIVRRNALAAAGAIRVGYGASKRSGNLQNGVTVEVDNSFVGSRYGARYRVVNKARHAYIYEYGTEARHYFTEAGKRHETGAMPRAPAARAFVPKMIAFRQRMWDELESLLVRKGLAVKRAA